MFGFLKGYRSIIGCIGAVASFIALVATQLIDGFQLTDVQVILAGFSALALAIGWTGKLTNLEETVKK